MKKSNFNKKELLNKWIKVQIIKIYLNYIKIFKIQFKNKMKIIKIKL